VRRTRVNSAAKYAALFRPTNPQVARAPGAVRGKGFFRIRIELAGRCVPFSGGVELRRVECLCSTAFSMSSAVVMSEIWHLGREAQKGVARNSAAHCAGLVLMADYAALLP
jgi:hypothetical protein